MNRARSARRSLVSRRASLSLAAIDPPSGAGRHAPVGGTLQSPSSAGDSITDVRKRIGWSWGRRRDGADESQPGRRAPGAGPAGDPERDVRPPERGVTPTRLPAVPEE